MTIKVKKEDKGWQEMAARKIQAMSVQRITLKLARQMVHTVYTEFRKNLARECGVVSSTNNKH